MLCFKSVPLEAPATCSGLETALSEDFTAHPGLLLQLRTQRQSLIVLTPSFSLLPSWCCFSLKQLDFVISTSTDEDKMTPNFYFDLIKLRNWYRTFKLNEFPLD